MSSRVLRNDLVNFLLIFLLQRKELDNGKHALQSPVLRPIEDIGETVFESTITDKNRSATQHFSKRSIARTHSNDLNPVSTETEYSLVQSDESLTRRARNRMINSDDRQTRVVRLRPLPCIHLNGDTSKYVLGTHAHFNGNGHLKHIHDKFIDWKVADWAERTGMTSHFEYKNGALTIRDTGLYLIYAQIYYLDEHDVNGYRIYKNDDMILQCTVSLHSNIRTQKGNTCYTSSVEYFLEGDKISLGDILPSHYSLFEPGKSFFGVVKLGDVRSKNWEN